MMPAAEESAPLTTPSLNDDDASSPAPSSSPPAAGSPGELIDELVAIRFDAASAFVVSHDPRRIRAALARARSLPQVRNLAGLVRYLVETPGPIADPEPGADVEHGADPQQFTKGKYGHLYKF